MNKFFSFKMKPLLIVSFFLIILLASFLRFYKLDQIPPSLNWDEIDAGYNAFTIANWGKDEWGETMPLIFTSFRDDKHPVHIYSTAIFIKIFGLTDFVTRSPGAFFGVLNVILIFFLAKKIFQNNLAGIFSSFLLAISPYNIHFSRGLWETNFALFYFMLGLLLFYQALEKKNWLLILSFLSFLISMLSYHSSKVVVPVVLICLITLYFKQLIKLKSIFYSSLLIIAVFIVLIIVNPRIVGLARANQTRFSPQQIEETQLFHKTQNPLLGNVEIIFTQYLKHFSIDYLYLHGDQSPRNSIKVLGEFYKFEAPLFLLGLIFLIKSRSKIAIVLLIWLLVAPLPSALVQGAPNATRALFMLGVFQLIEVFGIFKLLQFIKNRKFKYLVISLLIIVGVLSLKNYTDYYFYEYSDKEAIEWQYGMRQVVEFVNKNPDYSQIFMTDVRSQPYIYFLYYLKYPLPQFLESVRYNNQESKSYNIVYSFDKYQFGGWDEIHSMPDSGLVYVVEDSKYGGLAHKDDFSRVEKVKFPNGNVAFYIVSKY